MGLKGTPPIRENGHFSSHPHSRKITPTNSDLSFHSLAVQPAGTRIAILVRMIQDVQHSFRLLLQNKGWTLVAILTLALGIAPAAALFSLVDHIYAPIPARAPEELVFWDTANLPRYIQLRDQNSTLTGLLAFSYDGNPRREVVSARGITSPNVEFVSGNYFSVLGIPPVRGRTILPEDDSASASPVAMIGETYWERVFHRSPDAIGETIEIDGNRLTIIGIWPTALVSASGNTLRRDAAGPMRPEVMVPLAHHPKPGQLFVMGRRKPGVSLADVNAEVANLRLPGAPPGMRPFKSYEWGFRGVVVQFQEFFAGSVLTTLLLAGFFGTPLFLACINIATFLASRAEDRRSEIAMRLSLGASRGRLIRQFLIESVVLTSLGAFAGAMFSYWWARILANPPFGYYGDFPLNWKAFAFVASLVLPVSLGCGLLPATDAIGEAGHVLQSAGTHFSRSTSRRTRRLIAIQVALSFFGVFCIALLLRTVQTLDPAEANYNVSNIATFTINADKNRSWAQYEQIATTASQIPGVQSVSFSDQDIIGRGASPIPMYIRNAKGHIQTRNVTWFGVDSRFFQVMSQTFALGGSFSPDTGVDSRQVVIGEALARSLFPDENPLGKHLGRDPGRPEAFEIVGVVKDERPDIAKPVVYAHDTCCGGEKTFVIRGIGPLSPMLPLIRRAVLDVSPQIAIKRASVPSEELQFDYVKNVRPWKLVATYYAGFAAILVITGVFGLTSHWVARRTREIGIRMAIGAERSVVLRTVLLESVRIAVPGVVVGFAATVIVSRLLWSLTLGLFSTLDMLATLIVAIVSTLAVAAIAGYLPARRASRVQPIMALRQG
jgi:predicted permease